jgi:3-hydroxyacyl-[acyl-carrier-protein] dehydratase
MPSVSETHPALAGHFPGDPVVPGVVLVDHMLDAIAIRYPDVRISGAHRLKFLRVLRPAESFSVMCTKGPSGRIRVRCVIGEEVVAEGSFEICP